MDQVTLHAGYSSPNQKQSLSSLRIIISQVGRFGRASVEALILRH